MVDSLDQFLILSIFAVSLNLLSGYAGQVSIAHGAFGAVGGFLAGYLSLKHGWGFVPTLAVALAGGAVLGGLVALPALMLSTEHLILLTLAVQTAVLAVIGAIPALGGVYGLVGLPAPTIGGATFLTPDQYVPLLLVIALVVLVLCAVIGRGRPGLVLRGIREDELATRSLGINVFHYKVATFALTAGLAGLAGALLAYYNGIAAPGSYGLDLSISIVVMVVIGGSGNLAGSLIGAAFVTWSTPFLEDVISLSDTTTGLARLLAYGLILIAVLMIRPQGILPEGVLRRRSRGEASDAQPSTSEAVPAGAAANEPAHAEPGAVLVDVEGVSKSFGGIRAVQGLSFELRAGRITGLIGPNGAGKTTVFNLLTGTIKPDSGTVRLLGEDVTGWTLNRVARAGMVRSFQDVRTFPRLTVLDNVRLGARSEARALEQLAAVGLEGHRDTLVSSLSFGEQKLVALARVLATDARVLLLDEPASGIDAAWVDRMLEVIERIRRPELAICIVEHNLHVVERLADHVYFMESGRVTAEGTMADLSSETRLTEAYFGVAH